MSWGTLTGTIYKAAGDILADMPEEVTLETGFGSLRTINPDHIEPLASHLHLFIAHIIAGLTNAGSERDAVLENDVLANAILNELKDWTTA